MLWDWPTRLEETRLNITQLPNEFLAMPGSQRQPLCQQAISTLLRQIGEYRGRRHQAISARMAYLAPQADLACQAHNLNLPQKMRMMRMIMMMMSSAPPPMYMTSSWVNGLS